MNNDNRSFFFFFSSRRRHTRFDCDWSSDVCSSDLYNSSNTTHLAAICQQKVPTYHVEDAACIDAEGGTIRFRPVDAQDRKSTRLNSSHSQISYAVFCLKKKKYI